MTHWISKHQHLQQIEGVTNRDQMNRTLFNDRTFLSSNADTPTSNIIINLMIRPQGLKLLLHVINLYERAEEDQILPVLRYATMMIRGHEIE